MSNNDSNKTNKNFIKRLFQIPSIGTVIVFIAIVVFFSLMNNTFFTFANIINIIRQVSILIIVGVGLNSLLIGGHIDMSVGAIVGLTGVLSAMFILNYNMPVYLSFLLSILVGGIAGLINALIVTKLNMPALLATLGMMTSLRGFAYIISNGNTFYNLPPSFLWLGSGMVGPIPVPIIIMVIIFIIFFFIQQKTSFSVHTYAIGANKTAARLSGINVEAHTVSLFVITGLLAGLGGVMTASRIGVGSANMGTGFEFDVITAVVVGGTSIFGGIGSVWGTILGALIIGVITNGMVIVNLHSFWQQLAKGLILIIAVGAETVRHRKEQ